MPNEVNNYNVNQAVGYGNLYDRATKYLLTINNPLDHGMDHETIKKRLLELVPIYFCISDEIGAEEKTPHTHAYVVFKNARRFGKIKKAFPAAHIDQCIADHEDCINYVFKEGNWENTEKGTTNLRDTHIEVGKRPTNLQGVRSDLQAIQEAILMGQSVEEILADHPDYIMRITDIERAINFYKNLKKRNFRYVECVYICGTTGSGKTSYVMDRYGAEVYRVTDYKHPFDAYNGERVVLMDEFKGQVPLGDMLNYLDGHRHTLPARYSNREPEYDKVYVVSNTPFEDLYIEEEHNDKRAYEAWIRRFRAWMFFGDNNLKWVSTSYDEFFSGITISLEDFEVIEAREAITKPLEIQERQDEIDALNVRRKEVEERVAKEVEQELRKKAKRGEKPYEA